MLQKITSSKFRIHYDYIETDNGQTMNRQRTDKIKLKLIGELIGLSLIF